MTDAGAVGTFHPSTRAYRFALLFFVGLLTYGSYFAYDVVGALAPTLMGAWHTTQEGIGSLYTAYSVAAIFTVALGGYLADRIGTRLAGILLAAVVAIGAAMVALAPSLEVAIAGRFMFGAGSESLIVTQNAMLARWFRGKELALSFGVTLAIARLGTLFSFNSASATASRFGWRSALWIAVLLCVVSLLCALVYWLMDRKGERALGLAEAGAGDKIVLADVKKFTASYWFVVLLCVTFYSAIFPFQTFAIKFFQEAHGTTREFAGFLSSLLTLFAMIFTPLFGYLVDRVARRALFMMYGSLLLVPVYLMMVYTHVHLLVPMAMMGIAFSLVPAVLWPSVAYIVEEQKLGTAYGLMTMIQNIGLAGYNFLIGWANDFSNASAANPGGYALGMWIFSLSGFLGFFFSWMLHRAETGPHAHGLETITTKSGA